MVDSEPRQLHTTPTIRVETESIDDKSFYVGCCTGKTLYLPEPIMIRMSG